MKLDRPGAQMLSQVPTTFTDPRLGAAIVDRLTFGGNVIETGTKSRRPALTLAQHPGCRVTNGPT